MSSWNNRSKVIRAKKLDSAIKTRVTKEDLLEGLEPFDDIVNQMELDEARPREVYQAIRAAQTERLNSLDGNGGSLAKFNNDFITLTVQEKNFVVVHEQDIKGGILRETAVDTLFRIKELLEEQSND